MKWYARSSDLLTWDEHCLNCKDDSHSSKVTTADEIEAGSQLPEWKQEALFTERRYNTTYRRVVEVVKESELKRLVDQKYLPAAMMKCLTKTTVPKEGGVSGETEVVYEFASETHLYRLRIDGMVVG